MAQTLIRGSTQILDGSIPWAKMASGAIIPTSSLADGANFVKRDGSVALTAAFAGGGQVYNNMGSPLVGTDGANKNYVDSAINGLAIRRARMVFTTNIALSGLQNTDGLTASAGDRAFLTGQSTPAQNGLWLQAVGAWTRPGDWAAASSQKSTQVFVEEGTTYHDTKWIIATDGITVDTTSVTATQDQSGITYTNGNGLSLTGNSFAVKLAAAGGLAFDGSFNIGVTPNGTSLNVSAAGVKVADGTAGQIMLATPGAAFTTMSGDVTITSAGVTAVNNVAGTGFMKYTNYVANETVGGTINGTNTAFTLATAPAVASLDLKLNGVTLEPGAGNDYTISGTAITMLFAPVTGDKLRAFYFK